MCKHFFLTDPCIFIVFHSVNFFNVLSFGGIINNNTIRPRFTAVENTRNDLKPLLNQLSEILMYISYSILLKWIEEIFIKQYHLPELAATMKEDVIFIKKGEQTSEVKRPGKVYRLLVKSHHIEAIIAELDPHSESRWFQHDGEEMHLVLQGNMEYSVGEKSYKLSEGDSLWHLSSLKHRARNIGKEKVIYITVGSPPTFIWSAL